MVDLPGVIASLSEEQQILENKQRESEHPGPGIIDTIEGMVTQRITRDSTIILGLHPANGDIATSRSSTLIGTADPLGSRTIGVLTKFDHFTDYERDNINLLTGQRRQGVQPRHGYFAVVLRSEAQANAGMTFREVLEIEEIFFDGLPDRLSRSNVVTGYTDGEHRSRASAATVDALKWSC